MDAVRWQRLKTLYDKAVDLSSASQRSYLAKLGSTSLVSSLKRLFTAESDLQGFLEDSTVLQEDWPSVQPTRALKAGDVLNERYEVAEFLGAGGMGEVYRAFDRHMQQWIALKTLPSELSSNALLAARLRREVQLAWRVTHVNICRLHDIGYSTSSSGASIVFLTMELLDGKPLSEVIGDQPLDQKTAEEVAAQVISGLSAAHDAGIIHRDLKSANIFIASDTAGIKRAVITDFGLAHELAPAVRNSLNTFGPNSMVGTPAYMAPEQIGGGEITKATDIYSLGIVLFEMISGRLPIEDSSPLVIAMRRLHDAAPDVRKYAPDVKANWRATIAACLERNPAQRPHSVVEVGRMLAGEVSVPRRWPRRSILIPGAAALSAGAVAVPYWLHRSHSIVNPEAQRHLELGDEFTKRRTEESLVNAVAEYEAAIKIAPTYAEAWTGLANAYSAMANFNILPPRVGLDKARNAAERAVQFDPSSGRAQGSLAYVVSIDLQRWLQAGPLFEKAVRLSPKEPLVRLWYAAWLGKTGRIQLAIDQLNIGLEQDPASFLLHHQMAFEYFHAKRFKEFLSEAREVVRLQPYEANSHLILARALEWNQRYDEALQSCTNGEKYGDAPSAKCFRGCIQAAAGNLIEANQLVLQVSEYWKNNPFETILLAQLLSRIRDLPDVIQTLLTGYQRDDSSVLTAPTSPYLEKWQMRTEFRQFKQKLGFPL